MTKEEMQALQTMFEEERKHTAHLLKAEREHTASMIRSELQPIKDDLVIIKEESAITRHSVNLLLKWAEKAERSVNVGLYDNQ